MTDGPENIDIEGSVAVVTGGANGIGKGIVKALLSRGASVVIADIEEPVIAETVAELSQFGPLDSFVTDVADETSVEALSEYVFDTQGKCNLLFNNAGVGSGSRHIDRLSGGARAAQKPHAKDQAQESAE